MNIIRNKILHQYLNLNSNFYKVVNWELFYFILPLLPIFRVFIMENKNKLIINTDLQSIPTYHY